MGEDGYESHRQGYHDDVSQDVEPWFRETRKDVYGKLMVAAFGWDATYCSLEGLDIGWFWGSGVNVWEWPFERLFWWWWVKKVCYVGMCLYYALLLCS